MREDARQDQPFGPLKGGVALYVRVTPRAKRTKIKGLARDERGDLWLAAAINAPPVDGAANEALIALIAKALGAPRSSIRIHAGESARQKVLVLEGDARAIAEKIRTWIAAAGLAPLSAQD